MKFYMRISDGLFPCYQQMVDKEGEDKFKEVKDITESYDPKVAFPAEWNKPWTDENGVLVSSQVIYTRSKEELAERKEQEWQQIRRKRDAELDAMDKFKYEWPPKHPTEPADVKALDDYMQALRDLPSSVNDPADVVFPERPEFI